MINFVCAPLTCAPGRRLSRCAVRARLQAHARSHRRWSDRRRGDRTKEQSHGQSEVARGELVVDRFE